MKKFLLISSILLTLAGCQGYAPRKELSSNINFTSGLPSGEYTFNLVKIDYPTTYNGKLRFFKDLTNSLNSLNEVQLSLINLIVNENMERDFISLLNTGFIDREILPMTPASELNEEEKEFIKRLNIPAPENAGETQALLNKQYYLLLALTESQNLYNPNILYTELDKQILMENTLLVRTKLITLLGKLQPNFVFSAKSDKYINTNLPIYSEVSGIDFSNPLIFAKSDKYSGFTTDEDSLIIFTGNNPKFLSTYKYKLTSNLIYLKTPKDLENYFKGNVNSSNVSNILEWNRSFKKPTLEYPSLKENFDK